MTKIFTTPACQSCRLTKRYFDEHDIAYETVDLSTDEESMEYVKSLGYSAAPVVVTDDDHWSGFRPDKLGELSGR